MCYILRRFQRKCFVLNKIRKCRGIKTVNKKRSGTLFFVPFPALFPLNISLNCCETVHKRRPIALQRVIVDVYAFHRRFNGINSLNIFWSQRSFNRLTRYSITNQMFISFNKIVLYLRQQMKDVGTASENPYSSVVFGRGFSPLANTYAPYTQ